MSHIVETLIRERAPRLMRRPLLFAMLRKLLNPALHYQHAIDLIEEMRPLPGREVLNRLIDRTRFDLQIVGLSNVPQRGCAVLLANHPAGIADGLALYKELRVVRSDVCFFANRDAVRCLPGLEEVIIPVEWVAAQRNRQRSRETVRAMNAAVKAGKLIVIFPSGRLAQPTLQGLIERPWLASGTALAQRYKLPLIPVRLRGYNTLLYYLLYFINTELKDLTLFREFLHTREKRYEISFARRVTSDLSAEELTRTMQSFVTQRMPRANQTPQLYHGLF
jgi:putative hemolysin